MILEDQTKSKHKAFTNVRPNLFPFFSCLCLRQDESEVDFHKYPSSSLPDLVSTCSAQDAPPSPGDGKENLGPDLEDVRASSLSLPTQYSVRTPDAYQHHYLCLSSQPASFNSQDDCLTMLSCGFVLFYPMDSSQIHNQPLASCNVAFPTGIIQKSLVSFNLSAVRRR